MTLDPAATFEPHRRRLFGLAYRMLGSVAEAEDAVQETYLRWHRADRAKVEEPRAFLVTTTTRICLDALKSARSRREAYVGPWLPDPIIDTTSLAPDAQTALAEDLSVALLLALDKLSPLERAAFLLHDVFDYSFSEVASVLNRGEAACRQLASRARTRVRAARSQPVPPSRFPSAAVPPPLHTQLLDAFVQAARTGDVESLSRLLASDARIVTDGGGKVASALNVIEGSRQVAAFLAGVVRKGWTGDMVVGPASINGLPGLTLTGPRGLVQTTAFEIVDGVVAAIYVVRNPDKLRHLT